MNITAKSSRIARSAFCIAVAAATAVNAAMLKKYKPLVKCL